MQSATAVVFPYLLWFSLIFLLINPPNSWCVFYRLFIKRCVHHWFAKFESNPSYPFIPLIVDQLAAYLDCISYILDYFRIFLIILSAMCPNSECSSKRYPQSTRTCVVVDKQPTSVLDQGQDSRGAGLFQSQLLSLLTSWGAQMGRMTDPFWERWIL